jgi:ribonuclease P protein component
MLPKPQRLNLKKDFKWVASGKSLDTKYAKLFLRVGQNQTPRLGIASSSKNFKQAVDRNRARRIFSAAFEPLFSKLIISGLNIVALPKQAILSVKSGDVLLELEQIFKKEKLIDENTTNTTD